MIALSCMQWQCATTGGRGLPGEAAMQAQPASVGGPQSLVLSCRGRARMKKYMRASFIM